MIKKPLTLDEIKTIEFTILKNFKKYCEENKLRYYLSNGTLLGAVKYKGFIPWDDDIDILMPREDYNIFIRKYSPQNGIELLCTEHNEDYIFPFAKLSDMSTKIDGQTILSKYHCGVHIDIFPLDNWNEDYAVAQEDAKKIQNISRMLGFSISKFCKGRTLSRTIIKNIVIAYSRIWGWKYYNKKLRTYINKCLVKSGACSCGCLVWPVYGNREIIPVEVFSTTVQIEFEGEFFSAPIGYDVYLRSLYGNYEEDPPISKQRTHHLFKAYKI